MEQLTLSWEGHPAKGSASLETEGAFRMNAADWPCTLSGYFQSVILGGSYGKTSQELFRLAEDGTSGHSSGHWTNAGITSHGECLMLDFSECPSDDVESSLSGILETGAIPQRYFLSARACEGILRRDVVRGKITLVSRAKGAQALDDRTSFCLEKEGPRRLTPLEWERLQGFPDGWTDTPRASDTARYKAIGNSMAIPVMRWLGERIDKVNKTTFS